MTIDDVHAISDAIDAVTHPLFERIKSLESEVVALRAAQPVPGPPGAAGKDADEGALHEVKADVLSLREELRGLYDTRDKSVTDAAALSDIVTVSVEKAITARPVPVWPDVSGIVAAEITKAVSSLPVAKDGRDGVGVAGAIIDRDGALVLTLSDGATKSLGAVVGKDGARGADGAHGSNGRDGVGFDDLEEVYEDDGRVLVRKFLRDGAVVREFRHVTKQPIYRGVYESGRMYQAGDEVTWGGSVFQAKSDTSAKPGEIGDASRAWVLKVKKGAEGKKGADGANGKDGKDGRDLRVER